jgi:hypothetical protein
MFAAMTATAPVTADAYIPGPKHGSELKMPVPVSPRSHKHCCAGGEFAGDVEAVVDPTLRLMQPVTGTFGRDIVLGGEIRATPACGQHEPPRHNTRRRFLHNANNLHPL